MLNSHNEYKAALLTTYSALGEIPTPLDHVLKILIQAEMLGLKMSFFFFPLCYGICFILPSLEYKIPLLVKKVSHG